MYYILLIYSNAGHKYDTTAITHKKQAILQTNPLKMLKLVKITHVTI